MSKLKVTTISDPDNDNTALSIDSSGNVTVSQGFVPSKQLSHRNLIINGAMQIDQRGTTTATTITGSFGNDRWFARESTGGTAQIQNSTDAPDGFTNSFKYIITSSADLSSDAGGLCYVDTPLEGNIISNLAFGTSSAKTVTLSFWVKSSLTGTFAGALGNERYTSTTRSYVFNYDISTANTWEYKTITISGDTTGTWNTNSSIGMSVLFSLGSGSNYEGTLNTWQSGHKIANSGAVRLIGTNSATWQITGVQLEVGSVATPYEHRSYGEELARCKRYYQQWGGNTGSERVMTGFYNSSNQLRICLPLHPNMRTTPSIGVSAHSHWKVEVSGSSSNTAHSLDQASPRVASINVTTNHTRSAGDCGQLIANDDGTNNSRLYLDAEL